ncbi:hypothetical protein [Kineosporia sp. A_224]|uniref:hypothetical protein n=1 Tax=Kineosporia sp. A_224 TaxID=1962180 RepID=UPI00117AB697|nr:hypothetical protein [Kineosporia sp. A_224]
MWDVLRNAVTSAKDALGIELPELPELPAVPEIPAEAVDAVDAVTGVLPDLAGAGDAAGQALTDAGEAVATAVPDVVQEP